MSREHFPLTTHLWAFLLVICALGRCSFAVADDTSCAQFVWNVTLAAGVAFPAVVALFSLVTFLLNSLFPMSKLQQEHRYTRIQFAQEVVWVLPTVWIALAVLYFLYLWRHTIPTIPLTSDSSVTDTLLAVGRTVVFFLLFDTFEYWLHFTFHRVPMLYRNIHRVHHQFTAPSLLSGLAFHPIEGFLFVSPLLGLFWFPVHVPTLNVLGGLFNSIDLLSHVGFQIPLYERLRWIVGTTAHHDYHHQHFKPNYSVYLSVWDSLRGTSHTRSRTVVEKCK